MELTGLDWTAYVLIVMIVFIASWFISGVRKSDSPIAGYFPYGLTLKLIGGGLFTAIYFYVYKMGDTFLYFYGSHYLSNFFWENPELYFEALASTPDQVQEAVPGILSDIPYARTDEEWFMVRVLSVMQLVSFNNYLILTLWTSLISFVGSWYIFKLLNHAFRNATMIAFISAFLIPSVFFWSTGIIKDSFVFGLVGVSMYKFYQTFIEPKGSKLVNILIILFCFYVIYRLKSYIVISLVPPMLLAMYIQLKGNIKNRVVRFLSGPLLAIVFAVFLILITNVLAESSKKYNAENLEQHTKGFHSWHSATGGSTYSLGEIEYTPTGVARKIPEALAVSFYRPFLWEISSPTMSISALEGLLAIFASIYLIFYKGITSFRYIFKKPLLSFALIFALILGFVTGFTSYNFGALARYKTPYVPFFYFMLLYMASIKWYGREVFSKDYDSNQESLESSDQS